MIPTVGRRGFVELLGGAALLGLAGTAQAQVIDNDDFPGMYGLLVGPESERPGANGAYFDQWDSYRFVYVASDSGARYWIETGGGWAQLDTKLVQYAEAELPTNPGESHLSFNEERKTPQWYDGEAFEWPTFVDNDDVVDTPVTVSNESTETEVYRVQTGEKAMVHKRVFILRLFGIYNTENSSSSCRVRAYVGPEGFTIGGGNETLISDITTVEENVTDGPWQIKVTMTVRDTGTSGELGSHAEASFNNNKADNHEDAATVDTTTASGFAVTVEWGADASAGNSFTLGQAYLQQAA